MKKINENAIIQRIRLLREQFAGKRGKSKFASEIGISPSTYNYYENNRVPPIEILLRICQFTNADLQWLLTGTSSLDKSDNAEKTGTNANQNQHILKKIDNLLNHNPEMTAPISAFIDLLCEQKALEKKSPSHFSMTPDQRQEKNTTPSAKKHQWIPVLGRTAAGMVHFWDKKIPHSQQAVTQLEQLVAEHIGKPILNTSDKTLSVDLQIQPLTDDLNKTVSIIQIAGDDKQEIVEFVDSKNILDIFPDSFALRIDGDSMAPRIKDSDIIILTPSVPAAQGQIAVVKIKNQIGVTCKLIRSDDRNIHLIPINEAYQTKIVNKNDMLWALAVLCHIRL